MRVPTTGTPENTASGVPWFPVVGCLIGVVAAGVHALALTGLPPLVAATLAIGSSIWISGALHEDGLADMADALGGSSRSDAARILKDPALGTFGVLALVVSVLTRVGALASLDAGAAIVALPAAHAMGRAGTSLLFGSTSPTPRGLASSLTSAVTPRQIAAGLFIGAVVGGATLGPFVAVAILLVVLAAGGVGWIAARRLGTVTGDVLGAAEQFGEISVLLLVVAAIEQGWLEVPWWS